MVIISGETDGERIDNLMAVGASAYLTKPISVRDFLHTLDTLLTQPVRAPAGGRSPGRAGPRRTVAVSSRPPASA